MSLIKNNHIYTSQAIADFFTYQQPGYVATLTSDPILINKNPDQSTTNNDFTVTINKINTTKVTIDSKHVENLEYVFKRDSKTITNKYYNIIGVDANQGTVEIEPKSSLSTLYIAGEEQEKGVYKNTGTATLTANTANIKQVKTIELDVDSDCSIYYCGGKNSLTSGPGNSTRLFAYTKNGGSEIRRMYQPGAAYFLGATEGGFYYFTIVEEGNGSCYIQYLIMETFKPTHSAYSRPINLILQEKSGSEVI